MERWQPEEPIDSCGPILNGPFPERGFHHGAQLLPAHHGSLRSLAFSAFAGSCPALKCRWPPRSATSPIKTTKKGLLIDPLPWTCNPVRPRSQSVKYGLWITFHASVTRLRAEPGPSARCLELQRCEEQW